MIRGMGVYSPRIKMANLKSSPEQTAAVSEHSHCFGHKNRAWATATRRQQMNFSINFSLKFSVELGLVQLYWYESVWQSRLALNLAKVFILDVAQ